MLGPLNSLFIMWFKKQGFMSFGGFNKIHNSYIIMYIITIAHFETGNILLFKLPSTTKLIGIEPSFEMKIPGGPNQFYLPVICSRWRCIWSGFTKLVLLN